MNPSPYVSRFTGSGEMPKCSTHLDMLDYTDLMTFFIKVGSRMSGWVWVWMGMCTAR